MAKFDKINLTGMTIQDVLDIDPNDLFSLNKRELTKVASKLVSASNKRLVRLKKARLGNYAPAYIQATEKRRKFSVKGKTANQIRHEITDMRKFLKAKTSTVKGWNKLQKEVSEKIGGNIPKNKLRKFWRIYRKFAESHAGLVAKDTSDRILQLIREIYIESGIKDEDSILELLEDASNLEYEFRTREEQEQQKESTQFDNEGFFIKK